MNFTPSEVLHATLLQAPNDDPRPVKQGARMLLTAFAPCTLSQACVDLLAHSVDVHRVNSGPLDMSRLDEAPSWWLLAEGRIAVGRVESDGRFVQSRRVAPGEWFDVAGAWTTTPWVEVAVCNGEATLWGIPLDVLARCCRLDPDFVHAMGHVMAERIRGLTEARHELATKDVLSCVAMWLHRHVPASATDLTSFRIPDRKRSIARELAMAQETLSRCLRGLVDLGCIAMAGYQITVLDLQRLRAVAGLPGIAAPGASAQATRTCGAPCSPAASRRCVAC